ncbi:MAG: TraR/DksA C4-type zinc finger protein [Acidimicrobiales bacterium]
MPGKKVPAKKLKATTPAARSARPVVKATKAAPKKAPAKARAAKIAPAPVKAVAKKQPAKQPAKVASKAVAKQKAPAAQSKTAAVAEKASSAPAKTTAPRPPIRPPRPEPKRLEKGYTDEKFLAHQKAALERERVTYLEQAKSLQAEADLLIAEMEPGDIQFDEESGEGGTVAVDRERDLALSAQALEAVDEIDAALEKIATGKYGICENCGQLIAKARLEALPYARLCIACKSGGLSRR